MRVLWLSHVVPYPPKAGLLLRAYYLMRSVAARHELDLVAFVQEPLLRTFYPNMEVALNDCREQLQNICRSVTFLPIEKLQRPYGKALTAAESLLTPTGYMARWLNSKQCSQTLQTLTKERAYDIAHFDCISLAGYRHLIGRTPVTMGHHNAESHMLLRRAENENNLLRKAYFFQEGKRLARYERKTAPQFAAHITCSDLDSARLGSNMGKQEFHTIPNGVDVDFFKPQGIARDEQSIIFVSSMNWYPNVDAVLYLLKEIWPEVRKVAPQAVLNLVGSSAPRSVIELASTSVNVNLLGFVPEIRPLMEAATIYICPIRDGGGTKLKILDAFSMAKCVIAHPVACEGIAVTPGENVIFAETPAEFASELSKLIGDKDRAERIGAAARNLVVQSYSFEAIGQRLTALLERLASESSR